MGCKRKTYVLVHGSFAGGWCWQRLVPLLEQEGHRVIAPSLTGLADRSHLLSDDVGLDTHINDITNLLIWEDLHDVVLVGHSYGGMVVGGVAQREHNRIGSLIFVDAIVPVAGTCIAEEGSERAREAIQRLWSQGMRHWPINREGQARPSIDGEETTWPRAKMTAQPLKPFLDRSEVTDAYDHIDTKLFIRARRYPHEGVDRSLARVARWNWPIAYIDCGHAAMYEQPALLAKLIL